MLIIDKKRKDYYDGVVGTTGIDKTIVFNRILNEINDEKKFPKLFQRSGGWKDKLQLNQRFSYNKKSTKYNNATHFIIGFCGKLYLGFKMYYTKQNNSPHNEILIDFTYDVNEFKTHFNQRFSFVNFDEFVEYVSNYDTIDIHRELNTPIFLLDMNYFNSPIYEHKHFIINPTLKNYHFYKVFDTFTTFQEIQMYISGVLGVGENPMIEISDKNKITQHGFDSKWSFRKPPKEKK